MKEWEYLAPDDARVKPIGGTLGDDVGTKHLAQELSKSGRLEIIELREGLSIQSFRYVGRITLGNVQITIRPKIDDAPFLKLLRYAYGLRDLRLMTSAAYDSERDSFQELLIQQLAAEVTELVGRGLHRQYVRTDADLANPRGKINIQSIANRGGVIEATLPCTYHPRLEDCLINQILLQGLLLAANLTNNSTLRLQLFRLASMFEEISPIRLDSHALKKLQREMSRLTVAYQPAITIIELLLAAQGIGIDETIAPIQLPGFLFNMDLFFQELLSRFLKEHLPEYTVQDQYRIHGMMSYNPAYNPRRRRAPTPRPDYVVLWQSRVVAILDAKYRDLWENPLPEHMLYQLALYALSQPNITNAAMLYPTMDSLAQEARIVIHDPVYETRRAQVILRPVNLLYLSDLLSFPRTTSNTRKLAAFARLLAFGESL